MVALGMHLHHGLWSAAQTLGLTNNERARRNFKIGGLAARRRRGRRLLPRPDLRPRRSHLVTEPVSRGPDMPDTTSAAEPSLNRGPVEEEYDDAAGYYVDGGPIRDTKAPGGPLEERWGTRQFEAKIANPANRRRLSVIVVGTGLAGASAAATLGEAGYVVKSFCYQDSPRRAHSIAAQGGINAAKNYKGDGDSVYRLFYDTIKGGDYRSRESNVYRLAQVSVNIIDQCVAQGVPFAREYGGLLDNRSFGGVQVSRTFYARGQTGQQLLIGAYQALERQVAAGTVKLLHPARDARAHRGRRPGPRDHRPRPGDRRDRDLLRRRRRAGQRRLRQRLLPLHQRDGLQRHRDLAGAPQGRLHGQPLLHPDPPDLHPGHRHTTSRS